MAATGTTPVFHSKGIRRAFVNPTNGKTYRVRSYVRGRASVFAITSSVHNTLWGPKRWIQLQLHSCWTWKATQPHLVQASTQIMLGREDAELMLTALLTVLSEFDRQEEEEKSGGA